MMTRLDLIQIMNLTLSEDVVGKVELATFKSDCGEAYVLTISKHNSSLDYRIFTLTLFENGNASYHYSNKGPRTKGVEFENYVVSKVEEITGKNFDSICQL